MQLILKSHSHSYQIYLIATNNLEVEILKHKTHEIIHPYLQWITQLLMNRTQKTKMTLT